MSQNYSLAGLYASGGFPILNMGTPYFGKVFYRGLTISIQDIGINKI